MAPFGRVRRMAGSRAVQGCMAALLALHLGGCGMGASFAPEMLAALPQDEDLDEAPWPRLADQDFSAEGPDPQTGAAIVASLNIAAAAAAARAETLAGPVMTEAEARRLRDAGRRSR